MLEKGLPKGHVHQCDLAKVQAVCEACFTGSSQGIRQSQMSGYRFSQLNRVEVANSLTR